MPKKEDIEEIVEIDLSEIKLLSQNSRIRLNAKNVEGEDVIIELKPVSTMIYYDYLNSEKDEFTNRVNLVKRCLVSPDWSIEDLQEMPIHTFKLLFDYLMEQSYLKKIKRED